MHNFWLMLRSLFWVAALPGMVAGYIPRRFFGLGGVEVDYTIEQANNSSSAENSIPGAGT